LINTNAVDNTSEWQYYQVNFMPEPPKLLDQVRNLIRLKHMSHKTERAYVGYIREYILFHNKKHPKEMGVAEVRDYLTHLAVDRNVAASTQNVAFNAILFLYKQVLEIELPIIEGVLRTKRPARLPTVFTPNEAKAIINEIGGSTKIIVSLLYGSGLRLTEALRLRVKDIEFETGQIIVRDGKGAKDRVTILPQGLCEDLRQHLRHVKLLHEDDLARGFGSVLLPYALKLKYPDVDKEFAWTYVFPSAKLSPTREDGVVRRHHTAESTPQQAVKRAIEKLRIYKHGNCHTFRHSFARHLPENHYDIGAAQKLPCHKDVWTTQTYTHVLIK
jgi:integron integrase